MLLALVHQFARPLGADGVAVHQQIMIPAAGITWVRQITTNNPRRTWREGSYALKGAPAWDHANVARALDIPWSENFDVADRWALTHDAPLLFHVTDDEYLELKTGTMPRNVTLRAMRALESVDAVLVGAHAAPLADCSRSLPGQGRRQRHDAGQGA